MTPWLIAEGLKTMLQDDWSQDADNTWLDVVGPPDMAKDGSATMVVGCKSTGKRFKLTVTEMPSA